MCGSRTDNRSTHHRLPILPVRVRHSGTLNPFGLLCPFLIFNAISVSGKE